jgi:SAM-dependent MidA family methyltransferase
LQKTLWRFPLFFRRFKMADIFAAVDFATVSTWAAATGAIVIGIAMTFKAIDLGKRGVRKA